MSALTNEFRDFWGALYKGSGQSLPPFTDPQIRAALTEAGAQVDESLEDDCWEEAHFATSNVSVPPAKRIYQQTIKAVKELSLRGRKELADIFRGGTTLEQLRKVRQFLDRYRILLVKTLTDSQLASMLAGMREVVTRLPDIAPVGIIAPAPPPTLLPDQAERLVSTFLELPADQRQAALEQMPQDQRAYVRLAALAAETPPEPPWEPPVSATPDVPGPEIEYPIVDEAVRALRGKMAFRKEEYDALAEDARANAFTVAGVDSRETLDKIQQVMADEIRKGTDLPQFRKAIEDSVGTGTFLSDAHLETTFRTNVMRGYSEGLQRVLDHPLIESGFPYLQYAAVHDDRVRNEHLEMEQYGIDGSDVYRRDDPVIRTFMPPWAFNCRCSVIPLSVNDAAYRGIREAEKWLESGQPPSRPAWVRYPPFSPPAGWTPTGYYPKAPIAMSLDRRLANGCVLDVHYETVASELAIPQAWKQRIDVVDGEIKKAWVHADGSITYVEPPLQFAQGSGGATWTQYKGPQGGMGWRSSKTGRIAYQTEMPGEDEHGGESQAEPTGQQKPPQDTGKPPVNAQGETVIEAEGGTIRVPEGGEVKETQDEVIEAPGGTITVPGAGAEIEQVQPNLQRLLAKKEVGLI